MSKEIPTFKMIEPDEIKAKIILIIKSFEQELYTNDDLASETKGVLKDDYAALAEAIYDKFFPINLTIK